MFYRRFCVLTKTHLLSFKEKVSDGCYDNPTEVIPLASCQTVKSAEDETNKPDTFVRSEIAKLSVQKLEVNGTVFYFMAPNFQDKEGWIGALGKSMIKTSVMIDDNFD